MKTFEQCCEYLGISEKLPKCQIDEKKLQAAYKLRVCMKAWNKQDSFEPDEKANYLQENVGYAPYFYFKGDKLLSSGYANSGSVAGLVHASANYAAALTYAYIGLRLCLSSEKRAVEFGKVFIETFNELI